MKRFRIVALALATLGAVLLTTAAAMAAQSTVWLNVRSGPGTNYAVIDVLAPGETVTVRRCAEGTNWCYIVHDGPDGWVYATYLTSDPGAGPDEHAGPSFSITFGFPDFWFRFGTPNGPRMGTGWVCFYEEENYQGRRFCERPGDEDRRLSRFWDDEISSIRIIGTARVLICTRANYRGHCRVLVNSRRSLGIYDDEITSFSVR